VNVVRLWGIRIPASWLMAVALGMGPIGLWWAMNLSNVLAAVVAFIWFLRGDWKRAVIHSGDAAAEPPAEPMVEPVVEPEA